MSFLGKLLLLIFAFFCSSCVVQSTQLNTLVGFVKKPQIDLMNHKWSVSYGSYEAVVYALVVPQGILFSNNKGDKLLFDGWVVRELEGLRLSGTKRISDDSDKRIFKRGDWQIAEHSCDGWSSEKNLGKVKFSQVCKGAHYYSNIIIVDKAGDINLVRQIVDASHTFLTIEKL